MGHCNSRDDVHYLKSQDLIEGIMCFIPTCVQAPLLVLLLTWMFLQYF